ncbi:Hsp20/alpha crystallin family protein [Anaerobacillus arseniciselenatis]|nr:Hsp20/alpha crystallin family protein [Anaerobacillus arseniciselenatis]
MDRDMMEWMKPFQKTFDQDFFRNFNHLFDNNEQQNKNVKVNLYEGHNEMLCIVFLPGIENVEDISLTVHLNTIEIKGKLDVQFDNFTLTQKEFDNGDFKRTIQLPYVVREDKVDATYRNGLLIIHLYKQMSSKQNEHRINIKHIDE